ncbi:hypothetical protein A1Q2_00441 [Trichosporon asahii var. asahii CBS 8904]|uniref:Uncharacterized protein n=2 Tax=Trichosporon asahii var. asahii TaxID=189963 RepID=K1VXG7_TRIAC|nr:hypothetical protein A1Q1_04789 [Trichosporon asahii var. asahii CBS 2479]EJT46612.1 hypothetical protein A1Q1_04789 [Trichosporon asahii var. asahii CBS 2479]EKD05211.1 hypothetical protein A1Q2_00441 [Trichosporon asahii var. asahii CBS 8904]
MYRLHRPAGAHRQYAARVPTADDDKAVGVASLGPSRLPPSDGGTRGTPSLPRPLAGSGPPAPSPPLPRRGQGEGHGAAQPRRVRALALDQWRTPTPKSRGRAICPAPVIRRPAQ